MWITQVFRVDRIRRFFKVAREEGLGQAFSKLRMFLHLIRSGHAPSMLNQVSATAPQDNAHYLSPFWLEMAEREAFHVQTAPALLRKRRKIAMIGDLNLSQCRKYRVEQPDELWRTAGVDYAYAHYQDVQRCVSILQDATHVMYYRLQSNDLTRMYTYEARRLRLPILYDLDDPLFSISAYATYENMKALPPEMKAHFLAEAPKYLDTMMTADLISVSTPSLQAHTRLYLPTPVYCRRNFADRVTLQAGALVKREATQLDNKTDTKGGFRVAFASGSQGHEVDFAVIQDDLTAFLEADPARTLVILGHFDKALLPADLRDQIETHAFSNYTAYLRTLATVDCAVMPLTDDIFNRCKSGVRVIDAAAVSVPSLVGTVSDMVHMVEDSITGRVLPPQASWYDALEDLAQDPEVARAMGAAARHHLETGWSARTSPPVLDNDILDWATK